MLKLCHIKQSCYSLVVLGCAPDFISMMVIILSGNGLCFLMHLGPITGALS